MQTPSPELVAGFEQENRNTIRRNFTVASVVGMVLVPLFGFLDVKVYPEHATEFIMWRFGCSAAIAVFLAVMHTPFGLRYYRVLGVTLVLLPAATISYMVFRTTGAESPYYAGLNLVLLVVGFILRWTLRESVVAVGLVILLYFAACRLNGDFGLHGFRLSNYFFLGATGIIVVVGNYWFTRLRFDEFRNRHELDQKKRQLENTLQELKRTQDELITTEKQASLGVWSAGIIHEINNPLNFVRTGLYALRHAEKHLPESERAEFKEVMADIDDGVKRVHSIVEDLRSYAHPKNETLALVPLADVVRVALRFCSEGLRGKVEVVPQVPEDFHVFAERNKLIQVLTNLVQNSIHALEEKRFREGGPRIVIEGRAEGDRRLVVVRDNGPGIPPEHLEKVFDPFFTTKQPGKGMGLGLGICYRIIQGFGGTIRVRSEPGEFCEFTLDLRATPPATSDDDAS